MTALEDILASSHRVVVVGLMPIADQLSVGNNPLSAWLRSDPLRHLTCFYESDSDLFYASLLTDRRDAIVRASFTRLEISAILHCVSSEN